MLQALLGHKESYLLCIKQGAEMLESHCCQRTFCRLEEETGMQLRFAVGEVPEEHREEIAQEEASYGSFLHIPLKVQNVIYKSPCMA